MRIGRRRGRVTSLTAASLLAAAVFGFRAVRTVTGAGSLEGFEVAGVVLATVAAVLALSAGLVARRRLAWAALPLAPVGADAGSGARDRRMLLAKNAAIAGGLGLMLPVGFAFLTTGLVAPVPDLFAAYAIYGLLLTAAVWLAVRRSWWVLAVPFVSAGLWILLLWTGERFLDWSP